MGTFGDDSADSVFEGRLRGSLFFRHCHFCQLRSLCCDIRRGTLSVALPISLLYLLPLKTGCRSDFLKNREMRTKRAIEPAPRERRRRNVVLFFFSLCSPRAIINAKTGPARRGRGWAERRQGLEYLAIKVASSKRELRKRCTNAAMFVGRAIGPDRLCIGKQRLAIACRPRNSGIHRCPIKRYAPPPPGPRQPPPKHRGLFKRAQPRPELLRSARPRFFLADVSRFFGRQEYTGLSWRRLTNRSL